MDIELNIYSIICAEKSLQGSALNIETILCFEMLVPINKSVLRHIAEKSGSLHSRSHENIRCHLTKKVYYSHTMHGGGLRISVHCAKFWS
jgi:hypothetical protein